MRYNNKTQTARQKFLAGQELSPEEEAIINKDLHGKDFDYFQSADHKPLILPEQYSAASTFDFIEARIAKQSSSKRRYLPHYIASAAAIGLLLIISTLFYNRHTDAQSAYLYATTSFGEQKTVQLPDGSVAILNSLSSITYYEDSETNIRHMVMDGNAYFDVAKNPNKPFVVRAKDIEIKVLGTKFNVEAYPQNNTITTTLYEGSVSVDTNNGKSEQLEPGEKAVYSKDKGSIEVSRPDNISSDKFWQNKVLSFDNKSLSEILERLGREKNIHFTISDAKLAGIKLTARFIHGESVDEILNILSQSAEFTYTKQNSKYFIKPRN